MFQHRARISTVGSLSFRTRHRLRRAHGKTSLHRGLFRINAFGDKLLRRRSHAQAFVRACGAMGNRRGNQHDLAWRYFDNARLAFDRRAAGKLQIDDVVIRRPGELRLGAGEIFRRDPQAIALEDHRARSVTGKRRAAQEIERPDLRHQALSHARGADHRTFLTLHPNMLGWLPMRHKLANFFTHNSHLEVTEIRLCADPLSSNPKEPELFGKILNSFAMTKCSVIASEARNP